MAQPMTLIATPDPDSTPAVTCTEGIAFCDGVCAEFADGYHASAFTFLNAKKWRSGKPRTTKTGKTKFGPSRFRKTELSLTVYRQDTKNKIGKPQISLITANLGEEIRLNPARARMLAAALLNAADQADPLPVGVLTVSAGQVRIGDEIDTPDGWQKVNGLLFFPEANQAALFTPEKDDIDSDGYQHSTLDPIRVRRPLHGGAVVLDSPEQSTPCAVGWCSRCRTDRVISGTQTVSARGVIRVRGRCQTCEKRGQCAFVGLTSWAEDNR